jgi:hypothetical protein
MEDEDYTEEDFEEHPEANDSDHANIASQECVKVSDRTNTTFDEPHKEEEAAGDRTKEHATSTQPDTQQKSHGGMHVLIEQAVAQVFSLQEKKIRFLKCKSIRLQSKNVILVLNRIEHALAYAAMLSHDSHT